MSLEKYISKRDFSKTNEPLTGKSKKDKTKIFVIQFHQARNDHYDFRLEFNGVLISWAVPKGLSTKKAEKRLAVKVEDHPFDYANFEGVIPPKQYGAGKVEIWDKGVYTPNGSIRNGLKNGKISVNLFGEKLKGSWALVKMQDDNWLVIKEGDKVSFNSTHPKKGTQTPTKFPFQKTDVQLCTLTDKIPVGKDWLFEIKYDGYRIISYVDKAKVTLKTRSNLDYTSKLPTISQSLAEYFKNNQVVLDGEIVSFDKKGRSDFGLLQQVLKNGENNICYVIFDILALNGKNLKSKTLIERKKILLSLFKNKADNLLLTDYVIDKGKECFKLAQKNKLEGIVAKKINSVYSGKRTSDWLKIKCYLRQELVILGYTTTTKNKKLGAILLGYYDKQKLVYLGKAGTGFTDQTRKQLNSLFKKIEIKNPKIANIEQVEEGAIWIKPKYVAEIQFAEITKDNLLRQASFVGLRDDKKPKEIKLEYKHKSV